MRQGLIAVIVTILVLALPAAPTHASQTIKQVAGLTELGDVEHDTNVRVCAPATAANVCSLPAGASTNVEPYLDIRRAAVRQPLPGTSRTEDVILEMELWAKIPIHPSESYISYFWEFGGPCTSDGVSHNDSVFQLVWDGNAWSGFEASAPNCDSHNLIQGNAVPFEFTDSRTIISVRALLSDVGAVNTSIPWYAGVRRVDFTDPTYTNTIAVDSVPDVVAFNSSPPPAISRPEGQATFKSLLHPADIVTEMDSVSGPFLSATGASGVAIAVVVHNPVTNTFTTSYYNYGKLSKTSSQYVDNDTIFEIGSVTKLFTGIMAARYVENGNFSSLDAPLADYLPPGTTVPSFNGTKITLRDLADHSSALPKNPTADDTFINPNSPIAGDFTDQELYDFLAQFSLPYAPATQYLYSNLAFALLGVAEEQAAGGVYNDLEKSAISNPLGMTDTQVKVSSAQQSRLAQGYSAGGPQPPFADKDGYVGGGALRSTSKDMAKFLVASMQPPNTPLGQAMTTAKQQQSPYGAGPNGSVGLGWDIRFNGQPHEMISKDGSTTGFGSFIWFQADGPYGFVVLTNSNDSTDVTNFANSLESFFNGH